MTTYTYTSKTHQQNIIHSNKIIAVKFDPSTTQPFEIIAETYGDSEGAFTLTWEDWNGRLIIGAFDEEDQFHQLDCVFEDWQIAQEEVVQNDGYTYVVVPEHDGAGIYEYLKIGSTVIFGSISPTPDITFSSQPGPQQIIQIGYDAEFSQQAIITIQRYDPLPDKTALFTTVEMEGIGTLQTANAFYEESTISGMPTSAWYWFLGSVPSQSASGWVDGNPRTVTFTPT